MGIVDIYTGEKNKIGKNTKVNKIRKILFMIYRFKKIEINKNNFLEN
jgi:hypothetical protein